MTALFPTIHRSDLLPLRPAPNDWLDRRRRSDGARRLRPDEVGTDVGEQQPGALRVAAGLVGTRGVLAMLLKVAELASEPA
ncbi:MAG: hypothetical protein QHD01_17025 [Bradyrhizobium sp.]|uniref:hypothetical protein n=1 Tax=Bradyrhizobium sp. TaxID=376 RepID=UPI0029BAEBB2|nr:hypothetical protein [Bradyrhizobium sp.]MDX3968285.1 hypothetical protein [Bradyrhizobium sp.]